MQPTARVIVSVPRLMPDVMPTRFANVPMKPEQRIEDQVIANLEWLGYKEAPWSRRAKLGRGGFGFVDLLLLPTYGPHQVVMVEVKHDGSSQPCK